MSKQGDQTIELLRDWHAGNRSALDQLVKRNLEWLRAHVRARLGAKLRLQDETHDFVQDAVIDVLKTGPRFEISNEAHFRALLGKIVENNLRDKHRWHGRQRRDQARLKALPTDSVLQLDPPKRDVTRPSQVYERQERQTWVRLAIELLEAGDREVIWLRDWEELPFEEISERLDISANAARMRYRHALPRLARKVKELRIGGLAASLKTDGS